MHYLTMASDDTAELRNLQLSARLAGVELEVLGMGEPFLHYDDKLIRYHSYLQQPDVVKDDDLVVLLDAYDVVLFPAIRRLHKRIAISPTPVLACAESGIYPEPYSPWMYHQGVWDGGAYTSVRNSPGHAFLGDRGMGRFLNSGCIAGRGENVRKLVSIIILTEFAY
jgi:hypothetical protein